MLVMLLEDETLWHSQPCVLHDGCQAAPLGTGLHVDQDEDLVPLTVSGIMHVSMLRSLIGL